MSQRSTSPFERYGEPTPETDSNLVQHVYTAGETLSGLAHKYYEDWRLWRLIADRNEVCDPRRIETGSVLLIPNMPVEGGSFDSL